jgi:sugar-specific transcriptional regulator TrmB
MDSSLVNTLSHRGLNKKQATTYLALLELGQAPASRIAQKTKINRSVTYQVLKELVELGHVKESEKTRVQNFIALDPQQLLESARANFENLRFLLPVLRGLHTSHKTGNAIQILEGKASISTFFQTLDTSDERCFISSFADMERAFPEELQRWARRSAQVKRPTPTKRLLTDDLAGRAYAKSCSSVPFQEFRFLPRRTEYCMDICITKNVVALVSFQPASAIVIKLPTIISSAKTLFYLLWKQAKR